MPRNTAPIGSRPLDVPEPYRAGCKVRRVRAAHAGGDDGDPVSGVDRRQIAIAHGGIDLTPPLVASARRCEATLHPARRASNPLTMCRSSDRLDPGYSDPIVVVQLICLNVRICLRPTRASAFGALLGDAVTTGGQWVATALRRRGGRGRPGNARPPFAGRRETYGVSERETRSQRARRASALQDRARRHRRLPSGLA